jgi:hypothetical protein
MDDVRAVMDWPAASATLFGTCCGLPALLGNHPERAERLILFNSYSTAPRHPRAGGCRP